MQVLSRLDCLQVSGANVLTSTLTDSSNLKCECHCFDPAKRKFVDETDDSWIWWFISRPLYGIKSLVNWVI